jgi:hypothetical protein
VAPAGVALPALPLSPPAPPATLPPVPASPVQGPNAGPLSVPGAVPNVGVNASAVGLAADGRGGSLVSGRAVGDGGAGTFAADRPGTASSAPSARSNGAPTTNAEEQQAGLALRRALHEFGGCVGALPGGERRVLVLRANPGASQPRSRAQVGQLLGMSVAGVRAAESRGVTDLRQASRSGSCASGSGLETGPAFLTLGAGQPTAVAPQTGRPTSATRRRLRAVASAALRGEARPERTTATSPTAAHPDPPGSAAGRPIPRWLGIGLIALLALFLAAVVACEFSKATGRRQRRWYRRSLGAAPPVLRPRTRDSRPPPPRRQTIHQPTRRHPRPTRRSRRPMHER